MIGSLLLATLLSIAKPILSLERDAVHECAAENTCTVVTVDTAAIWDPSFEGQRVIGIIACAPQGGGWLYEYNRTFRAYHFVRTLPEYDTRVRIDRSADGALAAWTRMKLRTLADLAEASLPRRSVGTHPWSRGVVALPSDRAYKSSDAIRTCAANGTCRTQPYPEACRWDPAFPDERIVGALVPFAGGTDLYRWNPLLGNYLHIGFTRAADLDRRIRCDIELPLGCTHDPCTN